MNELTPSEPLPANIPLATLMSRAHALRGVHWDALVRAALSVRTPDDLDDRGEIAWDRVSPRDLDAPVTEGIVRAWLSTKPAPAAVRCLVSLVDLRDPRAVTREGLVRMAAEVHPDALADLLEGTPSHDPLVRDLYAVAGEAFGAACGRRLVASPYASFAAAMALATDGACAAYLREGAQAISPHEFGQVGNHLMKRPAVSDAVRAAYGAALVSLTTRLTNRRANELYVYTPLASAKDLEGALRASAKKPKVWARLAALSCAQGLPQGATALAAMLDDRKLGRHAAAALASMGAEGAGAARAWLDALDAKAAQGVSLARTILALPPAEPCLWAGEQRSLPRFGRAPAEDLRAAPSSVVTRREPTPLTTLEAALRERPGRDLLSPDGWADLLQIVALDPHLSNVEHAWKRANARGLLGRGDDPAAMMSALDTVRWDCIVTRHFPSHHWGVGHVLLWAGAGRDVFRHAVGRFEASHVLVSLGERERHFTKALDEARPAWAPPMQCLLRHYGANRDETAWIGPPPVLAALASPAASVELAAPSPDLWITGRVERATRFTVRFRGDVTVTVDVAAERWQVSGPASASGATPPLDPSRGVRFSIETARDVMYLGVDGAVVHSALSKLPSKVAPVAVVAEGEGAAVTQLTLHAKYTARAAEAAGELMLALDAAQGYTEVAGQRTPAAAHLLAACALLLEEPRAAMAREALAAMKGDGLDPWKSVAREGVAPPAEEPIAPKAKGKRAKAAAPAAPTEFTVRSYEDVVRAFYDAQSARKARSKKPAVLKRGQVEQGDLEYASFGPKPESVDWSARKAVPWPAVYLGDAEPPFDEVRYFVEAVSDLPALCRKGRGTHADVSYALDEGRYFVAAMTVTPPDGDDYDDGWWEVAAAAWKVDEGWAWAVIEGPVESLLPLLGMKALPPRVEWKRDGVPVGNW